MNSIIPDKLKQGDEVRVIAPSRSLAITSEQTRKIANQRFDSLGLKLSFGQHVMECDIFNSSSIKARLNDLHDAFQDKHIKAIFTAIGGYNVNQQVLCGYSDITALQNAIIANVDFGHTDPMSTFPIGGTVQIDTADKDKLIILSH